jgi:hypothetical protein
MTTRRRSSGKRPCSWARPPSTWSPPTPTTSKSSSPWTYVTSFSSPAMHFLRALVPHKLMHAIRKQQIIKALQAVSNAPVEIDPLRAKLSSAALGAVLSTENLVPFHPLCAAPGVWCPSCASAWPSLIIRASTSSRSRTRLPNSRGAGTSRQGAILARPNRGRHERSVWHHVNPHTHAHTLSVLLENAAQALVDCVLDAGLDRRLCPARSNEHMTCQPHSLELREREGARTNRRSFA